MKGVTIIINAHRESVLLHPTIGSVMDSCKVLKEHKVKHEVIMVLDRPDAETLEYLDNSPYKGQFEVREVKFGDLGLSRNYGVENAKYDTMAFVDGDDLFGNQWPYLAFKALEEREDKRVVFHPEMNIIFGKENHIFYHTDMESSIFDKNSLRYTNYWTALSFSSKAIYQEFPYKKNEISSGFGYEDWNWNCTTISKGIKHKIVTDTCHFIRRKENDSMLSESNKNKCLMTPSDLFKNDLAGLFN